MVRLRLFGALCRSLPRDGVAKSHHFLLFLFLFLFCFVHSFHRFIQMSGFGLFFYLNREATNFLGFCTLLPPPPFLLLFLLHRKFVKDSISFVCVLLICRACRQVATKEKKPIPCNGKQTQNTKKRKKEKKESNELKRMRFNGEITLHWEVFN